MARRDDTPRVFIHAQPVWAAAGLRRVAATGHGAPGLVDGGAGAEVGAAVAFGGIFDAGDGEGLREAVGLASLGGHVRGGGGGGGKGTDGGGFVGAAVEGPGGGGGGGGRGGGGGGGG